MASMAVNREEFVKKCEEVYKRNRASLEKEHDGKVVAIYEDGIAGIAKTTDEAYRESIKKHPNRIFYIRRIGKFSAADYVF